MARLGRGFPTKPFIGRQLAAVSNITLVFSTISWIWNKNTYSLAFTNVPVNKLWAWVPQAPINKLSLVYGNKAWIWNKNTYSLNFVTALTQRTWVWNKNIYSLSYTIALTQKTWIWAKSFTLQQFINYTVKSWQWLGNVVTSWPSGVIKRFFMLLGYGS